VNIGESMVMMGESMVMPKFKNKMAKSVSDDDIKIEAKANSK
jgi:hypothetical protein